MFVRKEAFESVGGFDKDYFLWGEDVDFCYRLKALKGWKIMYLPQFSCVHLKGGSMGIGMRKSTKDLVRKPLWYRLKMVRLSTEAMSTFVRKHYMDKYPHFLIYLMLYTARTLGVIRVFLESLR